MRRQWERDGGRKWEKSPRCVCADTLEWDLCKSPIFWRPHSIILSHVINMHSFSRWHSDSEYMHKLMVCGTLELQQTRKLDSLIFNMERKPYQSWFDSSYPPPREGIYDESVRRGDTRRGRPLHPLHVVISLRLLNQLPCTKISCTRGSWPR